MSCDSVSESLVCKSLICERLICESLVCESFICNRLICESCICERLVCESLIYESLTSESLSCGNILQELDVQNAAAAEQHVNDMVQYEAKVAEAAAAWEADKKKRKGKAKDEAS